MRTRAADRTPLSQAHDGVTIGRRCLGHVPRGSVFYSTAQVDPPAYCPWHCRNRATVT
jgi:hypothetical protein